MKRVFGLCLALVMMASFMVGCTPKTTPKEEVKKVELNEVLEAIKESLGEDYLASREMTIEELKELTGLKDEDIESFIGEAPMITMHVDTFMAIKAKEGKGEAVEEGLESYRKFLIEESFQYPMNLAKVNAAKVVRHGDYVFFTMLGKYDEREEATEEERLEFAKGEVEKVEEIINGFFK